MPLVLANVEYHCRYCDQKCDNVQDLEALEVPETPLDGEMVLGDVLIRAPEEIHR